MAGFFRSHRNGFTIVEILVVITVVGILAGIIIISYSATQNKAQDTHTIAMIKSATQAIEAYRTKNGLYPATSDSSTQTSCLGDGYPNNTCGQINVVGDCSAYGLEDGTAYNIISSNPELSTALRSFVGSAIPAIIQPELKLTEAISASCTLERVAIGPTYESFCYMDDESISYGGACGGAMTYRINYTLKEKDADCGVPSATANDSTATTIGTSCTILRGKINP